MELLLSFKLKFYLELGPQLAFRDKTRQKLLRNYGILDLLISILRAPFSNYSEAKNSNVSINFAVRSSDIIGCANFIDEKFAG
jgi:hypothetical protein